MITTQALEEPTLKSATLRGRTKHLNIPT